MQHPKSTVENSITEKDLYKYIFYPESLEEEKRNFIQFNQEKYSTSLKFLNDIKENSFNEFKSDILARIQNKIAEYEGSKEIFLEKITPPNSNGLFILAADSPKNESEINTETFQDSNNKFLGKVISDGDSNKIFILSHDRSYNWHISMTLFPSKDKFKLTTKDIPFIVTPRQDIEQIKLSILD